MQELDKNLKISNFIDTQNDQKETPDIPLSPMRKAEEIERVLSQYEDSDSKLIALAQIMK